MDREWTERDEDSSVDAEDLLSEYGSGKDFGGRPSPSWRGVVIAVIAAIILSVSATILLGGSFLRDNGASAAGCGARGACCAPPSGGR